MKASVIAVCFLAAFASPGSAAPFDPFNTFWRDAKENALKVEFEQSLAARIAMQGVLNGTFVPVSTYQPSASTEKKFADASAASLAENDYPGGAPAARSYVAERLGAYAATAAKAGEDPNSFATACAYFATTALTIQNGRPLEATPHRALKGVCVLLLAAAESAKKLTNDEDRELASDGLAAIASMSADRFARAEAPADRAGIKDSLAAYVKQLFGADLASFPVDNVACAGASDPKALAACRTLSNEKLATLADRVK